MEPMVTELLKSIIAAGPLAVALLYALKTVWVAYQAQIAKNLELQTRVLEILDNALDVDHEGKP